MAAHTPLPPAGPQHAPVLEGQPSFPFYFLPPLGAARNAEFQTSRIGICILARFLEIGGHLEIRKPCSLTQQSLISWSC